MHTISAGPVTEVRAAPRRAFAMGGAWPTTGVLIALCIGCLFGAAFLLSLAVLLAPPRLSVTVEDVGGRARIGWVLPGGNLWDLGVRRGDLILALDDRPLPTRSTWAWQGTRLLVRTPASRVVAADAQAIRAAYDTWPLLWLSPWFLLLATLVLLRARDRIVGVRTYALLASAACSLALAPGADNDLPVAAIAEFALVLVFAVAFFLAFPRHRTVAGRWQAALLAPPLAILALYLAAQLRWPALSDLASALRLLLLLVYLSVGIALLAHAFLASGDRVIRTGAMIVGVGAVASIAPFLALYLLPTVLGLPAVLAPEHAILALAALPASLTYAILRREVLPVPLLQRWLVHSMIWLVLLALYAAALDVAWRAAGATADPQRGLAIAVAVVPVAGWSFPWLSRRLRTLADRALFGDNYDYRTALQRLSREIATAQDLSAAGGALAERLRRLLNLRFALLLVAGRDGPRSHGSAGAVPPTLLPALVAAATVVQKAPRLVALADGEAEALVVPLCTQDALVGHLCLGPKGTGEPFRATDHDLLVTLSGHLAALVRNAALIDELQTAVRVLQRQRAVLDRYNERLQRAQEEERARLAADIHDEPLQTAISLERMLTAGPGDATSAARLARTVVHELRAACAAIRPALLDDLGLVPALDLLAKQLSTRSGVPIELRAEGVESLELQPEAHLVLYRAAQEALSNSLRHAAPRSIRMTVRCAGDTVDLEVADDGAGFAVPEPLEDLAACGHLGLLGLRERARRAGGWLRICSRPGAGTALTITLPLEGATA